MLIGLLVGFALALVVLAFKSLADAWIVTDPPAHADAIVVLGGGVQTRPFEAARLYHWGYAPQILIASPKLRPTDELGLSPPDTDVTKQILLKQGVPETAILEFGKKVTSTYDESLALCNWAKASGAKNVVVISDPFSSRRVRWLFSKYLNQREPMSSRVPLPLLSMLQPTGGNTKKASSPSRTRSLNMAITGSNIEDRRQSYLSRSTGAE